MLGTILAACLIASASATALSTLVLLVRHPSRHERPATQRGLTVVLSGLLLSFGPLVVAALGGTAVAVASSAVLLGAADLGWLRLTRSWSWRGHATWTATTALSVAYVMYMLDASLAPGRGVVGVAGSLLLWTVEVATFGLGAAYLWEVVDVLARTQWQRRCREGLETEPTVFPFVSLQVPAHNEPPDMVIATLQSLQALDYPAYEIVMVDDNTVDTQLWHPLRDFCEAEGIRFLHLEDWPGFKSGALNEVLRSATDRRAEVIGIIDADYIVDPDYLQRCATLFADRPDLGFVQTPQNYREWQHSAYYRRLFYSYEYFFRVSQASRNEVDGAIFGGTMGLIRRSALEQAGGWDEWCITEDAEMSLKLLRDGWTGQHIERPFGHGVMPLTFEALKKQRFRWCFGGVQILKAHWRSLLPWDRSPSNHLSQAQRWAYLTGGLQWFADVLGLVFAGFLVLGGVDLVLGQGLVLRRLSGLLLVLPALLLIVGLGRAVTVLRKRSHASLSDAVGALGLWLALGPTVALACVRGLVQPAGVFLRTPKTREQPSLVDALRANRGETVGGALLGALGIACAFRASVSSVVLAALLIWHSTGILAAPYNSLAAMRADLPAELRRRRRTERLREWAPIKVPPVPVSVGVVLVGAAIAFAFVLLSPSAAPGGAAHDVLGQVRGTDAPEVPGASTPSPRPTASTQPAATTPPSTPSPSGTGGSVPTTAPSPAPGTSAAPTATASTASSLSPFPAPIPTVSPTRRQPTNTPTSIPSPTARPTQKPTSTPAPTRRPTATPPHPTPTRRP